MKNYVVLTGVIASTITFKQTYCIFRLKQSHPQNLNINCIVWNSEIIWKLKEYENTKNKVIKILGMLKSNNYIKNSNIVYDYEIVITQIFENENQFL